MKIINSNVETSFKDNFSLYSLYILLHRAIPDYRDGLKPVHRRILWALHELKATYSAPYKKCARVLGVAGGCYHPHGESSIYNALQTLVIPWGYRYPLVDGGGSFGSIDGDKAAASRYTECRLSPYGELMLEGIDKNC